MKAQREKRPEMEGINDLMRVIERLRGENGCPWDKKQTPETMIMYLIEEAYELADAIQNGDVGDICEELGDVLFQIFFIGHIYEDKQIFSINDVAGMIENKMIRRHPHVFSNGSAKNVDEVWQRWVQIKQTETKNRDKSILASVPRSQPALMRSYQFSERASRVGFDWPDLDGVIEKVEEEWNEFKAALKQKKTYQSANADGGDSSVNNDCAMEEFGDVLFSMVNVGRLADIHPEQALNRANNKFQKRFECMEKAAMQNNRSLPDLSFDELDALWEQAKQTLKNQS